MHHKGGSDSNGKVEKGEDDKSGPVKEKERMRGKIFLPFFFFCFFF